MDSKSIIYISIIRWSSSMKSKWRIRRCRCRSNHRRNISKTLSISFNYYLWSTHEDILNTFSPRFFYQPRLDWITALNGYVDRITLFTLGRGSVRGNLLRLIRAKPIIYPVWKGCWTSWFEKGLLYGVYIWNGRIAGSLDAKISRDVIFLVRSDPTRVFFNGFIKAICTQIRFGKGRWRFLLNMDRMNRPM